MPQTQLDRFLADSRRASRNARAAAATATAGRETLEAAGQVVAARLAILAAGLADPARADVREMSLMTSEKVEALAVSTAALTRNLGEAAGRLGQAAGDELARAGRAAHAAAHASSPAVAAGVQFDYWAGWWSRAAGHSLSLGADLLRLQAETLAPIHIAAVANADRLKR